jgi:hypothetical protein
LLRGGRKFRQFKCVPRHRHDQNLWFDDWNNQILFTPWNDVVGSGYDLAPGEVSSGAVPSLNPFAHRTRIPATKPSLAPDHAAIYERIAQHLHEEEYFLFPFSVRDPAPVNTDDLELHHID